MYKRIITYTFEDDETRASFTELLLGLGFEEQPDQSTYAQKDRNPQHLDELKDVITDWSHDENLSEDDSIQIYFLHGRLKAIPLVVNPIADIILCLPIARGSILPPLIQELDELTVHDFL